MNFQLLLISVVVAFLYNCPETEQLEATTTVTKNRTATKARIMKAFLMQCTGNFNSPNNLRVTVQIAVKPKTVN